MSVLLPAKRASKITPIEAIRQTDDIKIKAKKLKTPKFIRKIFGEEGEIALKNLKRCKKRYRTTVISLVISIVLFITTNGFINYMFTGFDTAYRSVNYDFSTNYRASSVEQETEIERSLENCSGIKRFSSVKTQSVYADIPKEKINDRLLNMLKENEEKDSSDDQYSYVMENGAMGVAIYLISLNSSEYDRYLEDNGIDKLEENEMILVDYANMLGSYNLETNVTNYQKGDTIEIEYYKSLENEAELEFTDKKEDELKIAKVTDKLPLGITESNNYTMIYGIVSNETYNKLASSDGANYTFLVVESNDDEVVEQEFQKLNETFPNIGFEYVHNVKEEMQLVNNLKLVIQIFLYGFIALMSAIGISNVFNTISTNINLRRREFANLKSIGMTDKQFRKMLDLECIFYGTKALLFGIPIGVLICYLLNLGFGNMFEFIFRIPWLSIVICIIAIYTIVFVTMIYSTKKVRKENIIDVIRNDNV